MDTGNNNLLIVRGGGPTAVINASLYGAVREALEAPEVGRVLGARRRRGTSSRQFHRFQ